MARTQPKGLAEIQRNLGKAVAGMTDGADRGLVKGGLQVKRAAQQNTPVRLGNLRSSAYLVNKTGDKASAGAFKGEDGPAVESLTRSEKQLAQGLSVALDGRGQQNVVVGFGAGYAIFVHENQNAGAAGYDPDEDQRVLARGPRKGKKKLAKDAHSRVGGAKFFENALKSEQSNIIRILAEETKV